MVVRVRARATERLRCAVCHGEAHPDVLRRCDGCATRCHPDCATLAGSCPSLSCARRRVIRPTRLLIGGRVSALDAHATHVGRDLLLDMLLLRDLAQLALLAGLIAGALVVLFLLGIVAVVAARL